MKLSELAFACFLYGHFSDYDKSYLSFLGATNHSPDLIDPEHRRALLTWLNQWGCRQFKLEHHELASNEILSWYNESTATFLPRGRNLWELTEPELTSVGVAYESLSSRTASYRTRNGKNFPVSVGPTGAAKVLFAIRSSALAPWDDRIRRHLGYDDTRGSYVTYLRSLQDLLGELAQSCQKEGFDLVDLPRRLGRPHSTVPKLIDEYNWVTITRGVSSPGPSTFQQWANWSRL